MQGTFKHEYEPSTDLSIKAPLIASGILHVLIFATSIIGMPYLIKEAPLLSNPVSIEFVDLDKVTQTDKLATPTEKKPPKIDKPKPPPKKPQPQKMTSDAPPDLSKPAPPEPIQEVKKDIPKPETKKPEPKPKVVEQKKDFQSLLKNLTPDIEEQNQSDSTDTAENATDGQQARLADKLSMSELDAFKHQLSPCWNVPAGIKYAENIAVEIRVIMNRDMTVKQASVLDKGRYNRDTTFRAAADSALRALRNPRCSPLKLPPEKYDQWKTIVINFDPSSML